MTATDSEMLNFLHDPETQKHYFVFHTDVGMNDCILNLTVEVVPWMRGAVVLP